MKQFAEFRNPGMCVDLALPSLPVPLTLDCITNSTRMPLMVRAWNAFAGALRQAAFGTRAVSTAGIRALDHRGDRFAGK